MAQPWLQPRTSRILCEHSDHWATQPHGRSVTITPCLMRFVPESSRNHAGRNRRDSPFAARSQSTDAHWATKYYWGGKSTWPDKESNPGPLAYRASTLDHWATQSTWGQSARMVCERSWVRGPGRAMCFFLPCNIYFIFSNNKTYMYIRNILYVFKYLYKIVLHSPRTSYL